MPALRPRRRTILAAATAATVAVLTAAAAPDASAAVISVNVVGGQTDPGSGGNGAASVGAGNVAGVVRATNWNDLTPNVVNQSVVNSAGVAAANVAWSVNNTWAATGGVPGTPDANMMNGYLDNLHSQPPPNNTIRVTGLGSDFTGPGYSVIVYQNSDSAGSFGFNVADNTGRGGTRYGRQLVGGGGNYPLAGTDGYVEGLATDPSGGGTASNYVRITGLTGDSFTITGLLGTTGDGRVRPNGFQVVSNVPEPGAVGCFGALALFLGRRRRGA